MRSESTIAWLALIGALFVCMGACAASPEKKLLGNWQTRSSPNKLYNQMRFEFL